MEFGHSGISRQGGASPVGVENRTLSLRFRRLLSGFFLGNVAWWDFHGHQNPQEPALVYVSAR
jgi:hypothetical protein